MKRISDVLLTIILLPFFIIAILILATLTVFIYRINPFYVQRRIGKSSTYFKCIKMTSMLPTKNEEEINNKEIDKTRITKIGAMMRNHGLDELPQIYNVLLGNMSFIGPRPLLKKNIEKIVELNPDIPDQVDRWIKKRVSVKPGISGWEQVNTLGPGIIKYDLEYLTDH